MQEQIDAELEAMPIKDKRLLLAAVTGAIEAVAHIEETAKADVTTAISADSDGVSVIITAKHKLI